MTIPFQFKARSYLHFDGPISKATAEELACDPNQVASHSFYPFLGFTIETPRIHKDPKHRPIKIAAHADAAIYAHYARILNEPYEQMLESAGMQNAVTAFRKHAGKGRNNIWFANEAFEFIQANRPCVALAFDIEKFFDRMNHDLLKGAWMRVLGLGRLPADHFALFKNLTRFSWVERDEAYEEMGISTHKPRPQHLKRSRICDPIDFRNRIRSKGLIQFNPEYGKHRGIPQGSPISALLSNIYMFDFDSAMHAIITACGGLYRRYCDDIIAIVPPEHADAIEQHAMNLIRNLKLRINPEKTDHVEFPEDRSLNAIGDKELQYLGFVFNGTEKRIRNGSLSRYYAKMRRAVRLAKLTQRKHNRQETKYGLPQSRLRKRQLYIKYSYLADRKVKLRNGQSHKAKGNFLTYAYRASRQMNAPEIKAQVRNHWPKLQKEIQKKLKQS